MSRSIMAVLTVFLMVASIVTPLYWVAVDAASRQLFPMPAKSEVVSISSGLVESSIAENIRIFKLLCFSVWFVLLYQMLTIAEKKLCRGQL